MFEIKVLMIIFDSAGPEDMANLSRSRFFKKKIPGPKGKSINSRSFFILWEKVKKHEVLVTRNGRVGEIRNKGQERTDPAP